jgi:hypothetical protein
MQQPQLEPLSVGKLLDVAFGLYRALFAPLLIVTLSTAALPQAVSVYIEAAGGTFEHFGLFVTNLALNVVLGSIGTAASTIIVAEHYVGRAITAVEAFRRAAPFIGRVIVAAVLSTLLMGFGLMLLIIPGVIAIAGLAVTTPALVVEDIDSALGAMSRSWSLTKGHRWRILRALGTVVVVMMLPIFALGGFAATQVTPEGTVGAGGVALGATAALLSALVQPLLYCVLTVAYYDLRIRKEAYDLELRAASMAAT